MSDAANRDFDKYFGLTATQNHWKTKTADICDTLFLYKPTLPQSILKSDGSPSSFVVLSPYGTGKTMLRCAYNKTLNNQCFKVSLFNAHLSAYIERFIKANEKNNEFQNRLEKWETKDFAQILLSVLVTQFLKQLEDMNINIEGMMMDEKMDLIFIACYYYNGHATVELEKFVNTLLEKKKGWFEFSSSLYEESKAVTQIKENNRYEDKALLAQFQNDIQNFNVFDLNQNRKLHLLLAIVEGEHYQSNAKKKQMHGNVFQDLIKFSSFMKKHVNKKVVFIIDGIDENKYFFDTKEVNVRQLNIFYNSSVSQEILSIIMANNFDLAMFYIDVDGVQLSDVIVRKDKFPVYRINWNTKSLINYADYTLQQLKERSDWNLCKSIPSFKTLVNYSNNEIAKIIEKIPTPRALHYFMTELIVEMNNDAENVKEPFIANLDNVQNAFNKSKDFLAAHQVNEI